VPIAKGLLSIASAVVGEDFRETGRTMENLQLASKTKDELTEMLERGLPHYEVR
jgi:opine dehydrogenase